MAESTNQSTSNNVDNCNQNQESSHQSTWNTGDHNQKKNEEYTSQSALNPDNHNENINEESTNQMEDPESQNEQAEDQNGEPQAQNGEPQYQNGEPQDQNGEPQDQNGEPQVQNGEPQDQNEEPQNQVEESQCSFQKWNGGRWEKINLTSDPNAYPPPPPPTAAQMREIRRSQHRLPFKIMSMIGLPKSYRDALYSDIAAEMREITAFPLTFDTAAAFQNLLNWIYATLGKKEWINSTASAPTEPSSMQTQTAEPKENPLHPTDSIPQLTNPDSKIQTPFKISRADMKESLDQADDYQDLPDLISSKPSERVFELSDEHLRAIINDFAKEGESNLVEDDHPHEIPEVARRSRALTAFASLLADSETNIYARQQLLEEEEERLEKEAEKEMDTNENRSAVAYPVPEIHQSETNLYSSLQLWADEQDCLDQQEADSNENEALLGQKKTDPNKRETPKRNDLKTSSTAIPTTVESDLPLLTNPLPEETKPTSSHKREATIVKSSKSNSDTNKSKDKNKSDSSFVEAPKAIPAEKSTSDLHNDLQQNLHHLEDIVKKLYKSLNKDGPLKIVANFVPKPGGELAVDIETTEDEANSRTSSNEEVETENRASLQSIISSFMDTETESGESIATEFETVTVNVRRNKSKPEQKLEQKEPVKATRFEVKQPTKASKVEDKQSVKPNKADEKQPVKANKADEKQAVKASKVDEKQPVKANKVDEKQSVKSNKMEEKQPAKANEVREGPSQANRNNNSNVSFSKPMYIRPSLPPAMSKQTRSVAVGKVVTSMANVSPQALSKPVETKKLFDPNNNTMRSPTTRPPILKSPLTNTSKSSGAKQTSSVRSLFGSEIFHSNEVIEVPRVEDNQRRPYTTGSPHEASNGDKRNNNNLQQHLVPPPPRSIPQKSNSAHHQHTVSSNVHPAPVHVPTAVATPTERWQYPPPPNENGHGHAIGNVRLVKTCDLHKYEKNKLSSFYHPIHHYEHGEGDYSEDSDASTSSGGSLALKESGSEGTLTGPESEVNEIDKVFNCDLDYCQRPETPRQPAFLGEISKTLVSPVNAVNFPCHPRATTPSQQPQEQKFRPPVYIPTGTASQQQRRANTYREIFEKKNYQQQTILVDLTSGRNIGTVRRESRDRAQNT